MISVALCTYNGEEYIKQQLDSILSQTMSVNEVIVCDDCSTDSTCEIISSYADKYPHIHLLKNNVNVGFKKNFERALSICKGDFIFLSDQDDIWHPKKVKRVIEYMQINTCYGVFSDANFIDGNNIELDGSLFEKLNFKQYIKNSDLYPNLYATLCLSPNFVTGATMAIKKEAKKYILPFYTSEGIYHDAYIAIKLASIDKLDYIDEKLISYRIHSTQQIGINNESCVKSRIFDFGLNKNYKKEIINYLFEHRLIAEYIFKICKLNKFERISFQTEYNHYFFTVLSKFNFISKIILLFYYFYIEVKSRLYRLYGKLQIVTSCIRIGEMTSLDWLKNETNGI